MKKIAFMLIAALFLFTGIACSNSSAEQKSSQESYSQQTNTSQTENSGTDQVQNSSPTSSTAEQNKNDTVVNNNKVNNSTETEKNKKNPIVTIEMEDGNKIKAELYPDVAPNTVKNFISLINKGFYDGTIFHRVIPGFMIQGGDPQGVGTGGPGYGIKGEFANNGFPNNLKHDRGVLSMARSMIPDSAGSQFFIMVASAPHLDGDYAAFGKVIEGLDEVDKIVNTERGANDKPVKEQKMKKVTVDTFGVKYDEPEVIK